MTALRSSHVLAALILLCSGCAPARSAHAPAPALAQQDWIAARPEEAGLDSAGLDQLASDIRQGTFGNVHAVLVARNGRLAFESYFRGEDAIGGQGSIGEVTFDRGTLHDLRSVTKSVVSTLVGIAIEQRFIPSVDTPVRTLLPGHAHLLTGRKGSITLGHLLTMSAGLKWTESGFDVSTMDEMGMNRSADALLFVLNRDLETEPGTKWNYSGGATQLLAAIVEARTGKPLEAYAREVLFRPLAIESFEWRLNAQGTLRGASGLRLTGRDLIKLGIVFAGGGTWGGRQIVSPSWVREALRSRFDLPILPEDRTRVVSAGYGYQWWLEEYVTPLGDIPTNYAFGNGGQAIFIVPQHDLVVVTLAGFYNQSTWAPQDILLRVLQAVR